MVVVLNLSQMNLAYGRICDELCGAIADACALACVRVTFKLAFVECTAGPQFVVPARTSVVRSMPVKVPVKVATKVRRFRNWNVVAGTWIFGAPVVGSGVLYGAA
jgi:hypothetical protein